MLKYFKHYKNKPYKFKGMVRHSESLEELVVYETLYDNPKGKLWVRPKEMFFENIEKDGVTQPRFAQIPLNTIELTKIGENEIALLKPLLTEIFGRFDEKSFRARLNNRQNFHLLIAMVDDKPVGFKMGYKHDEELFYSWLGGVLPAYRNLGISSALMTTQHEWCKKQGLKRIQTRTKNKWREMIILNLRSGFDIIGAYTDETKEPKLILEKIL